MKILHNIEKALTIIVILILINTASFASDKTPGAVETDCVDVELYVEEGELTFERWMIENEQWEKDNLQVDLVQQSQSENIFRLDKANIDLLIEAQLEAELEIESWMLN